MKLQLRIFLFVLFALMSPSQAETEAVSAPSPGSGPGSGAVAPQSGSETDAQADGDVRSALDLIKSVRAELESSTVTSRTTRQQVQGLDDALRELEARLGQASDKVDANRKDLGNNGRTLESIGDEVRQLMRDIRANAADVSSQKTLIEDNSIRMYELLIRIGKMDGELSNVLATERGEKASLEKVITSALNADLNRLWILLSIVLVFFAPLAFVLAASSRTPATPSPDGVEPHQGMILACLCVFLGFFLVGFGLMYGETMSGWVGNPLNLFNPETATPDQPKPIHVFNAFLMYKAGFAMMGALIVYVAAGRHVSGPVHLMLALYVGAVLIPIYGHWVAASHFVSENKGWLELAGFVDQAGAITQNTVAGWFALILVWKLGQREGQADQGASDSGIDLPVYSSSATLLLWLSWLGFTTGTLHITSEKIPYVMVNVGMAASAGGLCAFLHYVFFNAEKNAIARGLGGFVSGLVAIAACAQSVTHVEAALMGATAGILQNVAYTILRKSLLKLSWQSDAAYLVAIHGVAGIWGALCFALLGSEGTFGPPNFIQLGIQVQGVAVAVIYSVFMANLAFWLFRLKNRK